MGNSRRSNLVVEPEESPLTWAHFYWFLFDEVDERIHWQGSIKTTDQFWMKFVPICKEGSW